MSTMELDAAIIKVFRLFARPIEVIVLQPARTDEFTRFVVDYHGADVAREIVIQRLMDLDHDRRLPRVVVVS